MESDNVQNVGAQGDDAASAARLRERLIELESLYLHVQRTLGELDQVVLAQQKQIDALERKIRQLENELGTLARSAMPERTLLDEKPPHY